MANKPKKLKRVAYRFLPAHSDVGAPMYRLLQELVEAHHDGIRDARIALAFNLTWKPDVDGRVTLGMCKKLSDLERELLDERGQPYDFVIILRQEFWTDPLTTDLQRSALLDHELCHAAVKIGEDGEPVVDERQRIAYRIRKHDIEEFECIPERYGCYKNDLERFYRAMRRGREFNSDRYIGAQTLQQELRVAGLTIPVDIVQGWSPDERREASTWAIVRQKFPLTADAMPAHLVAACSPERSPSPAVQ